MTNNFIPITKTEIDDALLLAKQNNAYMGRNPDAARLFDFIAAAGGFFGQSSTKGISRLAYAFTPSEKQLFHERKDSTEEFDYGYRRWENLRRGGKHFTPREAEFVHQALVRAVGPEWGQAFTPRELVTLRFHVFLQKALTLGLPWPDGRVPPSWAMEVIWLAQHKPSLTVRVIDPSAARLGGEVGVQNEALRSTCSLPRYKAGERYALQVRGLKPATERLFVFEAAQETLAFVGGNEAYSAFPVSLLKSTKANLTLKGEERPFEFYDIAGSFAFYALAFPADWDFEEVFELSASAERWTRAQFETFVRSVRRLQYEHTDQVRLGWYGYKVE